MPLNGGIRGSPSLCTVSLSGPEWLRDPGTFCSLGFGGAGFGPRCVWAQLLRSCYVWCLFWLDPGDALASSWGTSQQEAFAIFDLCPMIADSRGQRPDCALESPWKRLGVHYDANVSGDLWSVIGEC